MRYLGPVLLLFLLGCGFTPLHSTNASQSSLFNTVELDVPQTQDGFHAFERLEANLGHVTAGQTGLYRLSVAFSVESDSAAVSVQGYTIREVLSGIATWEMVRLKDNHRWQGRVRSFVSLGVDGSTVAVQTAQRNSRVDLIRALCDQIISQVYAKESEL